ncbi:MAG: MBOAT family protein [Candidatus Cloacimonetes bacterium]|nr:MBOAT family protein [Candidatus Cloacimonadota bacterium]
MFNYKLAKLLLKNKNPNILFIGVGAHLLTLVYFKYFNFFIDTIQQISGLSISSSNIVLPLAISFFTFQQIAYLVDVYQNKVHSQNLLDYSLFVSFFAQLIAGPIVHHKDIIPQFALSRSFSWLKIQSALIFFSIGLFKKVIVADTLAQFVDPAFLAASQSYPITFVESWGAVCAYSLQIYFDFSAYSDMAVGLALLFQIDLIHNFNRPYQATNIKEFWRRWHISLSLFLKNYLYIPLGGNRISRFRTKLNLIITMGLGGLWHGSQWTFVLWGLLHGLYLLIYESIFRVTTIKIPRLFATIFTFFLVSIAWVLFRSPDLHTAITMYQGLFTLNGIELDYRSIEAFSLHYPLIQARNTPLPYFSFYQMYCLIVLLFVLYFCPCTKDIVDYIKIQEKPLLWSILISILFVFSIVCLEQQHQFIYFRF